MNLRQTLIRIIADLTGISLSVNQIEHVLYLYKKSGLPYSDTTVDITYDVINSVDDERIKFINFIKRLNNDGKTKM